jgi:hypothetical protein
MTRLHNHPIYRANSATLKRSARNTQAPCARCGQDIDYTAHWNTPRAFTAGHIIDAANGGTHHLDNLQPEHRACNLRAGAKLGATRREAKRWTRQPPHPSPAGW